MKLAASFLTVLLVACGGAAPAPQQPAVTNEVPPTPPTPPPAPPHVWGDLIADGTGVKIVEVGKDDAYVEDSATIVGLICKVDIDLHASGQGYFAGSTRCADGSSYYFYQVRVEPAEAPPETALPPASPPMQDLPPPALTGISHGQTVAEGATFVIVALSTEDAFYEDSATLVNQSCTATSPLTETGSGLYGGNAKCSDGEDYTFYQVSIDKVVTP